jgi:hypothetical protein
MTEDRRCKTCNGQLRKHIDETPKEFSMRNYCGRGCRAIGRAKAVAEKHKGMKYTKKILKKRS